MFFNIILVITLFPSLHEAFLAKSITKAPIHFCYKNFSTKPATPRSKVVPNQNTRLQGSFTEDERDFDHIKQLKWNIPRILETLTSDDFSNVENILLEVCRQASKKINGIETDESGTETMQQRLPAHLASMRRFLCTGTDNEGCFRVFDDNSESTISVPPALLFSMDQPLSFIQKHLSYQSNSDTKGGMLYDNSEAVVFCIQSDQNLEYTSRFLDNMPLAQLHTMRNFHTSDCVLELRGEIIGKLESLKILEKDANFPVNGANLRCRLLLDDINVIRSLLPFHFGEKNEPTELDFQSESHKTLVKLIESAVKSTKEGLLGTSNEPHLVICAHSTNASIVASALSTWKQHTLRNKSYRKQHIEDLLRTSVTVITFGAVCQRFCDGPAYIHISMYDDMLAKRFGVTEKNQTGGGRDAVYLHAWSPFNELKDEIKNLKDHDAHNMNACAIQLLYLVMRINGIMSFRDLYNSANYINPLEVLDISPGNFAIDYARHKIGDLVIAPNMDYELLPAMIHATGGDKLLWNPLLCGHEDLECMPDDDESKVFLEEYFGYDSFEEINEICGEKISS